MSEFNIPVVLFIFRRAEKSQEIIRRIAQVRPKKLYILSDEGRNEDEKAQVKVCREAVEAAIDWPCEVILDYAEENRGVYRNIGEGSLRVFEKEEFAIFLEDDNLPEVSFFCFCEEMLRKYKDDQKVLWICGTNYLGEYDCADGEDYKFTQHMLPCGWASWSHKFSKLYDGKMSFLEKSDALKTLRKKFGTRKLYKFYLPSLLFEYNLIKQGLQPISWDYQMCLSIRANDLYGIVPTKNQIKNIGVDELSTHGGTSFDNVMTQRYCGMDSYAMTAPYSGPSEVKIDSKFERKLESIVVYPLKMRIKIEIVNFTRKIFKLDEQANIQKFLLGMLLGAFLLLLLIIFIVAVLNN